MGRARVPQPAACSASADADRPLSGYGIMDSTEGMAEPRANESHAGLAFHVEKAREEPIPTRKLMILVNDYVVNTCRFLNRFHAVCEEKLHKVAQRLTRTEITMSILESKINSVDYVTNVQTASSMTSDLPPVEQEQTPAAAAPATAPAAAPAAAEEPEPEPAPAPAAAAQFYTYDKHPDYKHYFMLLRLGVSKATIIQKIQIEGKDFDVDILDHEPDELTDTPIPNEDDEEGSE